jgi:hypothetical protein
MNRAFHGTSHLGRCGIDLPSERSLRHQLASALAAADNKRLMALQANNGDMWARAWESIKGIEEQLTLLDAIQYGYVVPLLSDEELFS